MDEPTYLGCRRRAHAMDDQVVLEKDAEARHCTASVPGLPIVVDAGTKRKALALVKEAIELYLEETRQATAPAIEAELVTVKV